MNGPLLDTNVFSGRCSTFSEPDLSIAPTRECIP